MKIQKKKSHQQCFRPTRTLWTFGGLFLQPYCYLLGTPEPVRDLPVCGHGHLRAGQSKASGDHWPLDSWSLPVTLSLCPLSWLRDCPLLSQGAETGWTNWQPVLCASQLLRGRQVTKGQAPHTEQMRMCPPQMAWGPASCWPLLNPGFMGSSRLTNVKGCVLRAQDRKMCRREQYACPSQLPPICSPWAIISLPLTLNSCPGQKYAAATSSAEAPGGTVSLCTGGRGPQRHRESAVPPTPCSADSRGAQGLRLWGGAGAL